MGKRNRALKHYFRQPRVAAEFYDVAVFDGEEERSPEELEDVSDFYGGNAAGEKRPKGGN